MPLRALKIFVHFVIHCVPLRFIIFNDCWQPVKPYTGLNARVNFVSCTNGFPLFSQIANVCTRTSTVGKGITPHCVSKCFIDIGDGIYQRAMTNGPASRLKLNLTRNVAGTTKNITTYRCTLCC